jgi:hypothetical protein
LLSQQEGSTGDFVDSEDSARSFKNVSPRLMNEVRKFSETVRIANDSPENGRRKFPVVALSKTDIFGKPLTASSELQHGSMAPHDEWQEFRNDLRVFIYSTQVRITANLRHRRREVWMLTGVYGPAQISAAQNPRRFPH